MSFRKPTRGGICCYFLLYLIIFHAPTSNPSPARASSSASITLIINLYILNIESPSHAAQIGHTLQNVHCFIKIKGEKDKQGGKKVDFW